MTVEGVPGSSPASITMSAPRRIGSGTSSNRRGSGPPALLALDCKIGQLTPSSAWDWITRRPSVRGSSPHARGNRSPGLGSSRDTGPGSSLDTASRVAGPSSGSASSASDKSKNITAEGLPRLRRLKRYRRSTASRSDGSQASP
jgi:hypothetical protein